MKKLFFKWLVKPLPKIIICISTSGCQDQCREFEWIGYVTKFWYEDNNPLNDFYDVQPLLKRSGGGMVENRDYPQKTVRAWQIQHLGLNLYIHYK